MLPCWRLRRRQLAHWLGTNALRILWTSAKKPATRSGARVSALVRFVDDHTLFSTKYGVTKAQFADVIIVAGRGWNKYDFNKLLERLVNPDDIPADRFDRRSGLRCYLRRSHPTWRSNALPLSLAMGASLIFSPAWVGTCSLKRLARTGSGSRESLPSCRATDALTN
jgi:hypothetical protein